MLTLEEQKTVCSLYSESRLGGTAIAKKLNIPSGHIYYWLKKYNIKRRGPSEARRVYALDQNYFDTIDTPSKAQIVGMIAADGNIGIRPSQKVLTVTLHKQDLDYLEFIRKELGYGGVIRDYENQYSSDYKSMSISNGALIDGLALRGIGPKKSLTLPFPTPEQIPSDFINSYILGYFEGDGSIYHRIRKTKKSKDYTISICVTLEFGISLQTLLMKELQITSNINRKKKLEARGINSYNLRISGNKQIIKFLDWIYKDSIFRMERKYTRYEEIKSMYNSGGIFIRTDEWKSERQKRYMGTKIENGTIYGANRTRDFYFQSPSGRLYFTNSVKQFARTNSLCNTSLYYVDREIYKQHKNWTKPTQEQIEAARANNTLIEKIY